MTAVDWADEATGALADGASDVDVELCDATLVSKSSSTVVDTGAIEDDASDVPDSDAETVTMFSLGVVKVGATEDGGSDAEDSDAPTVMMFSLGLVKVGVTEDGVSDAEDSDAQTVLMFSLGAVQVVAVSVCGECFSGFDHAPPLGWTQGGRKGGFATSVAGVAQVVSPPPCFRFTVTRVV